MKSLSKSIMIFFTSSSLFASSQSTIFDRVDGPDVLKATQMLQAAFERGNIGERIGNDVYLNFEGNKVFITSAGCRNPFELFAIASSETTELKGYTVEGKVQKNAFDTFKAIELEMLKCIRIYSEKNHLSFNDMTFNLQGFSKGTHLTPLQAITLVDNLGIKTPNILNFSHLSTFDETAAINYNARVGKYNHANFIAHEDFAPPIFTGEKPLLGTNLKFKSVGIDLKFSAHSSSSYREKVARNEYPYLVPATRLFAPFVITSAQWNAHMPETYTNGSHANYPQYQKMFKSGEYSFENQS